MNWLILLTGIASNACASVLIKLAMMPPHRFPSLQDPMAALANWPLLGGLFFYGVAFVLYAAALARLPLNVAQPVLTSGAIAAVAVLSALLFHESFRWSTVLGIVLVIAGVGLITSKVTA